MAFFIEVFLIGVSLSMDALAVSLALATAGRSAFNWKRILLTAFFFGAFQAFMPAIGWFGGSLCGEIAQKYGPYIAAILLGWVGGKMIYDSFHEEEEKVDFSLWKLVVLAFATSIDALLVGVSFACLSKKNILADVLIIGTTTFLISLFGCIAGRLSKNLCGNRCEIAGGAVLIGIGIKILFFG